MLSTVGEPHLDEDVRQRSLRQIEEERERRRGGA
jgi:hypothetical protein